MTNRCQFSIMAMILSIVGLVVALARFHETVPYCLVGMGITFALNGVGAALEERR